jgi:cysteine-rich repeat protein
MKKIYLMLSCLLVISFFLVSCGEQETYDDFPPPPSLPGESDRGALAGQAYELGGECYSDAKLTSLFSQNPALASLEVGGIEHKNFWGYNTNINDDINLYLQKYQYIYSQMYILKNCDEWVIKDLAAIKYGNYFPEDYAARNMMPWIKVDSDMFNSEFYSSTSAATSYRPDTLTADGNVATPIHIDDSYSSEGPQYMAVYACNREPRGWDCNKGKWVVFEFSVRGGATCSDGVQDAGESDLDCGGYCGATCAGGLSCSDSDADVDGVEVTFDNYEGDCRSGICDNGVCTAVETCQDGIQNQDELGVDCGGVCQVSCGTCEDGLLNQDESSVDCGGVCSAEGLTCGDGQVCADHDDCASGVCADNFCLGGPVGPGEEEPVCGNGALEGPEECDDGNRVDGDGCTHFCEIAAVCSNGVVEDPETCDDGNVAEGDGCNRFCQMEARFCYYVAEDGEILGDDEQWGYRDFRNILGFNVWDRFYTVAYTYQGIIKTQNNALIPNVCNDDLTRSLHKTCGIPYDFRAGLNIDQGDDQSISCNRIFNFGCNPDTGNCCQLVSESSTCLDDGVTLKNLTSTDCTIAQNLPPVETQLDCSRWERHTCYDQNGYNPGCQSCGMMLCISPEDGSLAGGYPRCRDGREYIFVDGIPQKVTGVNCQELCADNIDNNLDGQIDEDNCI